MGHLLSFTRGDQTHQAHCTHTINQLPICLLITHKLYIRLDEPERELSLLRKAIQAELEEEFTKNQAQISEQIKESILARYVPESALRRKSLDNDPQVKKAVETLKNKNEYYALLRPQRKVTTLADIILEQIERGELVEVKPGENTEAAL